MCRQISEAEALLAAASDAGKRERFTGANSNYKDQKLPIGYYALGNLEVPELPEEKFEAPTVKLVNDDILYAEIGDPNKNEHSLEPVCKGRKERYNRLHRDQCPGKQPFGACGEGVRNFGRFGWNVSGYFG
ncbi:MAG: hypothetical protein ACLR8P_07130 [Clostridium fessum]